MAKVFKNVDGIVNNQFQIGGDDGCMLENDSSLVVIMAKEYGGSNYAPIAQKPIIEQSPGDEGLAQKRHAVDLIDLQSKVVLVEYAFDGASPPSPAANTYKFGICLKTGGSYTAAQIIYDDGSDLIPIPFALVRTIACKASNLSVSGGAFSLAANSIYFLEGGAWTLKGGLSAAAGMLKIMRIPFAHNSKTPVSTATLSASDYIQQISVVITTAFNSTSSISIACGAQTLLTRSAEYNGLMSANQYDEEGLIDMTASGAVGITITSSAGAGAGYAMIVYGEPLT